MMRNVFPLWRLALFLFVLLASPARAEEGLLPDALVRNVSEEVLETLRQKKGGAREIIALVQEKVLPHFDFRHMTQLAVGRDWRKATPEQQNALTKQFRDLLVRTYVNAVSVYSGQKMTYKPLKIAPGDTRVLVRTEVSQSGGTPIPVDYGMEKTGQGWKVYDVAVGGVSLIINYRDSFAQEIHAGGIDGLIASLSAKNRELAAKNK
ncbi:MAG: ABC transporter substrate-binding protein [Zoogloeaceae bacterium]|jgi:phospholipid transport system substrate-binding protein|nr:ABC transporter substrate-binding protein [Zoogloeaceae bacterium]